MHHHLEHQQVADRDLEVPSKVEDVLQTKSQDSMEAFETAHRRFPMAGQTFVMVHHLLLISVVLRLTRRSDKISATEEEAPSGEGVVVLVVEDPLVEGALETEEVKQVRFNQLLNLDIVASSKLALKYFFSLFYEGIWMDEAGGSGPGSEPFEGFSSDR